MNCSDDVEIFLEGMYSTSLDNNAQICNFSFGFAVTGGEPPAGLKNIKNNCCLNDVLQCLTYTNLFVSGCSNQQCVKHADAGFCTLSSMKKHIMTARKTTGKTISPNDLVKICNVCFSYLVCFPFCSLQVCLFTKSD